jgi:SAM-dependent methyltransferase
MTPLYVRLLSHLVSPFPNFDFSFIRSVRSKATNLLQLHTGSRVLDVGCGSGGSFPYLVQAVGPSGKVVGVELSSSSAAHARRRASKNGWSNVEVLDSDAEEVHLAETYDGLLMFAAPDVFASNASLDHLAAFLRDEARIVCFGAKISTRRFGWLLNGPLHFALTRFSLPTTPGLELEPWRLVGQRVYDLTIEEYFYGWMFLASGTLLGAKSDASLTPR